MSDEKRSVVRIEYEYSDGTVLRATGEDAKAIAARIDSAFVMEHIHGGRHIGPFLEPVAKAETRPRPSSTAVGRCQRCGSAAVVDGALPPVRRCAERSYRWREV